MRGFHSFCVPSLQKGTAKGMAEGGGAVNDLILTDCCFWAREKPGGRSNRMGTLWGGRYKFDISERGHCLQKRTVL